MANVKIISGIGGLRKDEIIFFILKDCLKGIGLNLYLGKLFDNLVYDQLCMIEIEAEFFESINKVCGYHEWMPRLLCKSQNKNETIFEDLVIKKNNLFEVHYLIQDLKNSFIENIKFIFQMIFEKSLCSKGEVRLKPLLKYKQKYIF